MADSAMPELLAPQDAPGSEERGKRTATAAVGSTAPAPALKRPRYDGKAFGDLSITELEGIVRKVTDLERQVATRDEEVARLKEKLFEKTALAKQTKQLENELEGKKKEADKLLSTVREQDKDISVQADRVKRSLQHQLVSQMFWLSALKDQLKGAGREIVAFAPNVSPEVLKELGGELGATKTKYADVFFEALPTKTGANGQKLVLLRNITLKYVKASCELRVDATYRLADAKPPKKQAKKSVVPKSKSLKNGGSLTSKGVEAEDPEGDEVEDDEGDEEEEVEETEVEEGAANVEPEVLGNTIHGAA
uniref:Uncharacterized protein n=1 Tax=Alexandrium andersonii TaxID=327968 RepID=A0A7S2NMA8_9DINO